MDHSVLVKPADQPASGTAVERRKFRPELQGLRALAALLVVVYHVWLGRISGGVDVFFLISGFLHHRAAVPRALARADRVPAAVGPDDQAAVPGGADRAGRR